MRVPSFGAVSIGCQSIAICVSPLSMPALCGVPRLRGAFAFVGHDLHADDLSVLKRILVDATEPPT